MGAELATPKSGERKDADANAVDWVQKTWKCTPLLLRITVVVTDGKWTKTEIVKEFPKSFHGSFYTYPLSTISS